MSCTKEYVIVHDPTQDRCTLLYRRVYLNAQGRKYIVLNSQHVLLTNPRIRGRFRYTDHYPRSN